MIRDIAAVCFLLIFAVVLFLSGSVEYACKHYFTANNQWLFFAIGIAVSAILAVNASFLRRKRNGANSVLAKRSIFCLLTAVFSVLLLCVQCLIVHSAWFLTGWDVGWMVQVGDPDTDALTSYLSQYPNQLFLYGLFRVIARTGSFLGLQSSYLALVLGGCLCVTLAVWLSSQAASSVFGFTVGYLTFALSFFFVGLSPWIMVPYSDAYGVLCPSIVLFIYCCLGSSNVKWALIAFFSIIGYSIKPTAIFVLMAILFVELCHAVSGRKSKKGAYARSCHAFSFAFAFLLGLILAFGVVAAVKHLGPNVDSDKAFSISHFLMMGANAQTKGVYSADDAAASQMSPDRQSRQAMNVHEWESRIAELGPSGLAELSLDKTLCNFADGTFAWAYEGYFWTAIYGDNEAVIAFYGIGDFSAANDGTANARLFQGLWQATWLMVLLGMGLGFTRSEAKEGELIAYLSLVALAAFLVIFECRARYLYLYSPYFVMLGVAGWVGLFCPSSVGTPACGGSSSQGSRSGSSRPTRRPPCRRSSPARAEGGTSRTTGRTR